MSQASILFAQLISTTVFIYANIQLITKASDPYSRPRTHGRLPPLFQGHLSKASLQPSKIPQHGNSYPQTHGTTLHHTTPHQPSSHFSNHLGVNIKTIYHVRKNNKLGAADDSKSLPLRPQRPSRSRSQHTLSKTEYTPFPSSQKSIEMIGHSPSTAEKFEK